MVTVCGTSLELTSWQLTNENDIDQQLVKFFRWITTTIGQFVFGLSNVLEGDRMSAKVNESKAKKMEKEVKDQSSKKKEMGKDKLEKIRGGEGGVRHAAY